MHGSSVRNSAALRRRSRNSSPRSSGTVTIERKPAALAIATLWMGVYPKPFTDVMHTSVDSLLKHVAVSKL